MNPNHNGYLNGLIQGDWAKTEDVILIAVIHMKWKSKTWFRGPCLCSSKTKYAKQDQAGLNQTSKRARCQTRI